MVERQTVVREVEGSDQAPSGPTLRVLKCVTEENVLPFHIKIKKLIDIVVFSDKDE